ncbi:MAG: cell division protein ZapA [Ruminococcus sp.]|nr:cell division protein ZapA [Ruminococcus sp.]MCD7799666.1 cell division protein ZapA [Ruminococcus sp.]
MNRLKVVICGKEYTLQTKEDATYVYNLGRALEKKINSLVESNNVSAYNASVMVALSLLDDLKHIDKEYSKLQQSCSEIDKLKEQRDVAFKEIKRLNAKITQLEDSQRFKELGGVIPEYYTNPNNNNNSKNSKK